MWERFADHRQHVTGIVSRLARVDASLCILGAGGLNDLSLDTVLPLYRAIHLVDLDRAVLQQGLKRYGAGVASRIHLHGPLDLSGGLVARLLDITTTKPKRSSSTTALLKHLAGHHCRVPGQPFDVTVSAAVMSQMIEAVASSTPAASTRTPEDITQLALALRDKHLRDLVQLTAPGGRLVLISDMVSSATAPEILQAKPSDLDAVMAALIVAGNFFTGTNPFRIADLLTTDTQLCELVEEVHLIAPWLWQVREERHHLTYAIVARRRMNGPGITTRG